MWSSYSLSGDNRESVVVGFQDLQQQNHQQNNLQNNLQQQQNHLQQQQQHLRWGGDLDLASSPMLQNEGLIEMVVWGSDLELGSPGGFDSCIMDSSWTSNIREHCLPLTPGAFEAIPSPSSSAVSARNLNHNLSRLQQQIDNSMDVSMSSSGFNRGSVSGNSSRSNLNSSNDESVGSPSSNNNRIYPETSETNVLMQDMWDDKDTEDNTNVHEDDNIGGRKNRNGCRNGGPTERMMQLTLEELSQYFTMPIIQASKQLKVGLTVLKKRCRDFGISRWPHRKLKSLDTLIQKSQDLAKDSDGNAPNPVIDAVQELERQKKVMSQSPGVDLDERTKRFRQAIFKASYKQRRRASIASPQTEELHQ